MKTTIKLSVIVLINLITVATSAQYASVSRFNTISSSNSSKIDFKEWSTLLRRNTSVLGTINFSGFNKDANSFSRFTKKISTTKITNNWTQDEQKAYWINVYNAFSVKMVLDNFPVKNINEINKPYKTAFFEIQGKMMSLNDVEKIIADFEDPRMLLVLNKNSLSGVRLIKRAYTADELKELMDKRIRIFINNDKKNTITPSKVQIASIFKTYDKEIKVAYGSIQNFLNKYSDITIKDQKISYKKFNENVNSYQAYGE